MNCVLDILHPLTCRDISCDEEVILYSSGTALDSKALNLEIRTTWFFFLPTLCY